MDGDVRGDGAPGDGAHPFDLACRDVVELVTHYLEGALDTGTRVAVERHLARCPPCQEYLGQLRATIAATGRLRVEAVSLRTLAELVTAFRTLLGSAPHRPPER